MTSRDCPDYYLLIKNIDDKSLEILSGKECEVKIYNKEKSWRQNGLMIIPESLISHSASDSQKIAWLWVKKKSDIGLQCDVYIEVTSYSDTISNIEPTKFYLKLEAAIEKYA